MKRFIQRFEDKVTGILSGFDRLVFRGGIRLLGSVQGMAHFLCLQGIRLKEFGGYAQEATEQLKRASVAEAERTGRPVIYVESAKRDKEEIALRVAREDKITSGLIAIVSSVELCKGYDIYRNRETQHIELTRRTRKCLYLYHYYFHPEFGLMNARIQTWLPFDIQICLNGREWLAKAMDKAKIDYIRRDNCFTWLEDCRKAQRLLDGQLKLNWAGRLDRIARQLNPAHARIFQKVPLDYYWTVHQSEWATDLTFGHSVDVAQLQADLAQLGITHFSSPDVMRFLGKKVSPVFKGEIISSFKNRPEGIRIKHFVGYNSVKLYDKAGSVLRVETTINTPYDLKVYRPKENDPDGEPSWRPLRKGIADLYRRAQYSQACNERYLDALAAFDSATPLGRLLREISAPAKSNGRTVRGLRPWENPFDLRVLQTISRGEFKLSGFRNKNLQQFLFDRPATDLKDKRSRSSRISRLLRILRAHHLIKRIPRTYRYMLTARGTEILNTLFAVDKIKLEQLHNAVA
jgi:hypothetical protein